MPARDLITDAQRARLLANGRRDLIDPDFDPKPVVKLILPGLPMSWLLTGLDPANPDIAFGLCDLGYGTPELGTVSMADLAGLSVTGRLAPRVTRDDSFVARKTISAYAREARQANAIVTG